MNENGERKIFHSFLASKSLTRYVFSFRYIPQKIHLGNMRTKRERDDLTQ